MYKYILRSRTLPAHVVPIERNNNEINNILRERAVATIKNSFNSDP